MQACATCCSDWPTFSLQNSIFFPRSASNPVQSMSSIGASDGESPAFVASSPPFPGAQAYCAAVSLPFPHLHQPVLTLRIMQESQTSTDGPLLLSFGGKSDAWSLCTNITDNANGRVDLVFSPVTNHPHYVFSSCNAVTIQVIEG
jgi:hypothetical protein